MIYGCHLVAELEDSAQDLPSYCSVLPFSWRSRPSGKLLKEEVKNLCIALQLALTCARVRKETQRKAFLSKWDNHFLFYPSFTYLVYIDCKHLRVLILF